MDRKHQNIQQNITESNVMNAMVNSRDNLCAKHVVFLDARQNRRRIPHCHRCHWRSIHILIYSAYFCCEFPPIIIINKTSKLQTPIFGSQITMTSYDLFCMVSLLNGLRVWAHHKTQLNTTYIFTAYEFINTKHQ